MADETPEVDPLTLIRVVGGEPTPEDEAAAIAIVAGMLREGGVVDQAATRDRWSASARVGRDTAERGHQTWDEFTGQ
ncbi:MAG: hypothetical protein RLZ72_1270 [Actinomycetota bacterium]|jgi:hypothetical protein